MSITFKSSHRSQIIGKIKDKHGDLYTNSENFLRKYFDFLSRSKNWWAVSLHVAVLYYILAKYIVGLLAIVIDLETAKTIIDQRTSNVATIISMTLAVIGILLSNLAVKDNHTYKLLFVNSRLYLILYYTLSVIFCLILISTLRDTIDDPLYQQYVLSGTILALLILIGIGYLFSTIINFANASTIQNTLKDKLIAEAKINLQIQLLAKYSHEEFKKLMETYAIDFKEQKWIPDQTNLRRKSNIKEQLIYNIDFDKLKIRLADLRDQNAQYYYFNYLSLNLVSKNYNNFIWPIVKTHYNRELDFSECFTLKRPSKLKKHSDDYLQYFATKLEDYSAEGKIKKVDEVLTIYSELYLLEMKHK